MVTAALLGRRQTDSDAWSSLPSDRRGLSAFEVLDEKRRLRLAGLVPCGNGDWSAVLGDRDSGLAVGGLDCIDRQLSRSVRLCFGWGGKRRSSSRIDTHRVVVRATRLTVGRYTLFLGCDMRSQRKIRGFLQSRRRRSC